MVKIIEGKKDDQGAITQVSRDIGVLKGKVRRLFGEAQEHLIALTGRVERLLEEKLAAIGPAAAAAPPATPTPASKPAAEMKADRETFWRYTSVALAVLLCAVLVGVGLYGLARTFSQAPDAPAYQPVDIKVKRIE